MPILFAKFGKKPRFVWVLIDYVIWTRLTSVISQDVMICPLCCIRKSFIPFFYCIHNHSFSSLMNEWIKERMNEWFLDRRLNELWDSWLLKHLPFPLLSWKGIPAWRVFYWYKVRWPILLPSTVDVRWEGWSHFRRTLTLMKIRLGDWKHLFQFNRWCPPGFTFL